MSPQTHASRLREINESIRYSMWSVFKVATPLPPDHVHRDRIVNDVQELFAGIEEDGVTIRGLYDVAGLRADADFMVWWHSDLIERLQGAYHRLRRCDFGRHLQPVWSVAGLHRPAEFNKGHVPAFLADEEAKTFLSVYPFVRSYEWYLLPETERREMLVEHGRLARQFPDVRANTIASFALNDYEWLLAFEADDLYRIVDLMRELRASRARMHVREEVPFYTGARVSVERLVETLP
ncbi:MAG TPA: hydrogen peroxide-dependent heme synthase [Dermatophilaceae bacterium]|nr:hydrogen peroxide-dependent heme synthase [Dermatophilaceae bacterium]